MPAQFALAVLFTSFSNGFPWAKFSRFASISCRFLSRKFVVCHATCGVTNRFGAFQRE